MPTVLSPVIRDARQREGKFARSAAHGVLQQLRVTATTTEAPMSTKIAVNLPVKDLNAEARF